MSRKYETRIIADAHEEASRIIRTEEPQTATECLEDLLDLIAHAADKVRELAEEAGLPIQPRKPVDFPSRRSVMMLAVSEINRDARNLLGHSGQDDESGLNNAQVCDISPELENLVAMNTEFHVEQFEKQENTADRSAMLAVQVLTESTRDIALLSLEELEPEQRDVLRQKALEAITGEERAQAVMEQRNAARGPQQGE